jgi:DNA polymerase III delta subunit
MAVESALGFLRGAARSREVPPLVVIAGAHAFLRECVLDMLKRELRAQGYQYFTTQAADASGIRSALEEARGTDLFAARRLVVCRILKGNREAEDNGASRPGRTKSDSGGDGVVAMLERLAGPNRLVLLYERDSAPAKIQRVAENSGLLINCPRPFDNQIGSYADELARINRVKLATGARVRLCESFGGDLCAIANAIARASVSRGNDVTLGEADFSDPVAGRIPMVFEIANQIAHGDLPGALTLIERALELGREPLEILGVEMAPIVRRMLGAAEIMAQGKSQQAVAVALGLPSGSSFASRAIEGARRLGIVRLRQAHRNIVALEEGIKSGRIKEAGEALAGIVIELTAPAHAKA